ncbi:MAG: hypothetical protein V3V90_01030 [Thermodesulfobacteriota bacterium]
MIYLLIFYKISTILAFWQNPSMIRCGKARARNGRGAGKGELFDIME